MWTELSTIQLELELKKKDHGKESRNRQQRQDQDPVLSEHDRLLEETEDDRQESRYHQA